MARWSWLLNHSCLVYLTPHEAGPCVAWKGFDWDALDRLHQKGLIGDPKHTNKSVGLTDEGVAEAAAGFQRLFGVDSDDGGVYVVALALRFCRSYGVLYAKRHADIG